MILLQSEDYYDQLAEFDPASGQLTWHSKQKSDVLESRPIRGHVARLDGHTVILYRDGGLLRFRIDDSDFAMDDQTVIEVLQRRPLNTLRLLRGGAVIFELRYESPLARMRLELDPTPFLEREQFDFGEFVRNVTSDPDRKYRIYR